MENYGVAETKKKKKPLLKRWWFWVIAVFVLFIIGSVMSSDEQSPSNNTGASSNQKTEEPVLTVSAVTLYNEYEANQVAADEKYKNKLVEITGVVDTIGKDIVDTPYISFYIKPYQITTVQCMFSDKESAPLSSISKGQKLTVRGTVSGGTIGQVLVTHCKVM